jgi:hypothetical protein
MSRENELHVHVKDKRRQAQNFVFANTIQGVSKL